MATLFRVGRTDVTALKLDIFVMRHVKIAVFALPNHGGEAHVSPNPNPLFNRRPPYFSKLRADDDGKPIILSSRGLTFAKLRADDDGKPNRVGPTPVNNLNYGLQDQPVPV